ncbi:MAG: hypothetical protein M1821_004355 [Bathelium mastoideum]|nr:MAG: hypothetical protein M1821_004355 [Bathelium mastoideum]KAI9683979.1 MAG: hypothetical protein M1822_005806 [Bathelium mastoideum]
MSSRPKVNGDQPNSQFLSHLSSYPVARALISTYKDNSLGRKSLDLANSAYANFAQPLLPYLQGPYSIIAPYVAKADSLADSGLEHVDSRFPIVRENTTTIKNNVLDTIFYPAHVAAHGRDYLFHTYADEHGKMGGPDGLVKTAKTVISTELKVLGDVFARVGEWVAPKREQAKSKAGAARAQVERQIDEMKQSANNKKDK